MGTLSALFTLFDVHHLRMWVCTSCAQRFFLHQRALRVVSGFKHTNEPGFPQLAWQCAFLLQETPTGRHLLHVGPQPVSPPVCAQTVRSRYARTASAEEWPDDGYLDGVLAHADIDAAPLGDIVGDEAAGPLDDLLSQVTDLLSQMHELCQDD